MNRSCRVVTLLKIFTAIAVVMDLGALQVAGEDCLHYPWPYERNTLRPLESLTADGPPLQTSTATMVLHPELGLVMFRGADASSGDVIWTTNCSSRYKIKRATVDATGNLAVFDEKGHVCWQSGTHFSADAATLMFVLQDDCNFALYRQAPQTDQLWSTDTAYCLQVHLVPHSHDDVGWLMTPEQYFDGCGDPSIGVQGIIGSVVEALALDPSRTFTQVEMYFFNRWWNLQTNETRETCRRLVENGQLTFTNAGWSMSDEACVHQESSVANWEIGAQELQKLFGENVVDVRAGWHIDPFGHASTTARLMSQLGYDGFFFSRTDYQHRDYMKLTKTLETMWSPSPSLGDDALLFTSVMHQNYCSGCAVKDGQIEDLCNMLNVYRCNEGTGGSPPFAVNWGRGPQSLSLGANANESASAAALSRIARALHLAPEDSAAPHRKPETLSSLAERYVAKIRDYAASYRTNQVLIPWGCDFSHHDAVSSFSSMDAVMHEINSNFDTYGIRLFYSTPAAYLRAVHQLNYSWPVNTNDYYVDSDDGNAYWSGYFSSRAQFKLYERHLMNERMTIETFFTLTIPLQTKAIGAQRGLLDVFRQALGVAQHHDSITGTSILAVRNHYQKLLAEGWESANGVLHDILSEGMQLPRVSHCPLANLSACPATAILERGDNVSIFLLNGLAWARSEIVTIPVPISNVGLLFCAAHDVSNAVQGPSRLCSLVPVNSQISRTWELTTTDDPNSPTYTSHPFELIFSIELPPLSLVELLVYPVTSDVDPCSATFVKPSTSGAGTPISNEFYSITLDSKGRVTHIVETESKRSHAFQMAPLRYEPRAGSCDGFSFQVGQPAGAYIMRTCQPTHASIPLTAAAMSSVSVVGPVCSEIRQVLNAALKIHVRIRVCRGQPYVDVTAGMGPLPTDSFGTEGMLRFSTDVTSGALWYTDSQGLEMQRRERNARPNYPYTVTEPVASNIFPANSISMINDSTSGFAIVSDTTRGVGSMASGQLELLYIRRLVEDDNRGVGEALDEPIRVLSSSRVIFTAAADVMISARKQAALLTHKPLLRFAAAHRNASTRPSSRTPAPPRPALPSEVLLHTLEVLGPSEDSILVRLQHVVAKDEIPLAAVGSIQVDLAALMPSSAAVVSVQEMDISGFRPLMRDDPSAARRKFRVCDATTRTSRLGPTQPTPSLVAGSVVTLNPLEIRTFHVKVAWTSPGAASRTKQQLTLRAVLLALLVGVLWILVMVEVGARALNRGNSPLTWLLRQFRFVDRSGFRQLPGQDTSHISTAAGATTTTQPIQYDRSAGADCDDLAESDATAMEDTHES